MIRKCTFLVIFIVSALAFYKAEAQMSYPKHQFGVSFNTIAGSGLEYQIEFNTRFAASVRGIVYYFGDNPPNDKDQHLSFGFDLQYNLHNTRRSRFYSFVGVGYWQLERRRPKVEVIDEIEVRSRTVKMDFLRNAGLGVGYEYKLNRKIAFDAKAGMLYQSGGSIKFVDIIDLTDGETQFIGFGGGISFRYIF